MELSSFTRALLAGVWLLKLAYALPFTSSLDTLFCEGIEEDDSDSDCTWAIGDFFALSCTCNTQPQGQFDLCHFYSLSNYEGFEYNGYGQPETCYDFNYAQWNGVLGTVSAVSLGKGATSCCLYSQPGCVGAYTEVDSDTARFSGNTLSYKCHGAVPPPPEYGPSIQKPTTSPSSIRIPSTTSPESTSCEDEITSTPIYGISVPGYVTLSSASLPPSLKYGGIFTTPSLPSTPAQTLSVPTYPSYGLAPSFFGGTVGIASTPLPPPNVSLPKLTLAEPPYAPPASTPCSTSAESYGVATQTSPAPIPILKPSAPEYSPSLYSPPVNTPPIHSPPVYSPPVYSPTAYSLPVSVLSPSSPSSDGTPTSVITPVIPTPTPPGFSVPGYLPPTYSPPAYSPPTYLSLTFISSSFSLTSDGILTNTNSELIPTLTPVYAPPVLTPFLSSTPYCMNLKPMLSNTLNVPTPTPESTSPSPGYGGQPIKPEPTPTTPTPGYGPLPTPQAKTSKGLYYGYP